MIAQMILKSNQPVPLPGLLLIRKKWLWSKVKQKQKITPPKKTPLNKTSVNFSSCTWLTSFTQERGIIKPQSPRVCCLGDAKLQRENISVLRSKRTLGVKWLQGKVTFGKTLQYLIRLICCILVLRFLISGTQSSKLSFSPTLSLSWHAPKKLND